MVSDLTSGSAPGSGLPGSVPTAIIAFHSRAFWRAASSVRRETPLATTYTRSFTSEGQQSPRTRRQNGSANVCTPVPNAHLVCRPLLQKKNTPNLAHHNLAHYHSTDLPNRTLHNPA